MSFAVYLIIFGIVGLTTILSLVQWGYLLSLSSRIKEIEQEIEKKAQEFDVLRKNRNTEARPAPQTEKNEFQDFNTPSESPDSNMTCSPIQVIRPTDDTGDNDIIAVQPGIAEAPAPISNDEAAGGLEDPEGSIQIMKNVNGKFTDTSIFRIKSRKNAPQESVPENNENQRESFTPAQHPDTYDNPFSEVSDDKEQEPIQVVKPGKDDQYGSEIIPIRPSTEADPFAGTSYPEQNPSEPEKIDQSALSGSEPNDSGSNLYLPPEHVDSPTEILQSISSNKHHYSKETVSSTLPLYSDAAHDADFPGLCKMISQIISTRKKPDIKIDFSGIQFIYDKELQYLEKIHHIIKERGGKLLFINCSPELSEFLGRNPDLLSLIKKTHT
jgi:hypothetical protein